MDNSLPSEDLMARIAEGDDDAFEILVNRHQTSILNLIYRFIGDRTQAKDLAQEVFIRVWQSAKSYEPKAKFTTWIYQITANLCLNELKSARRKRWFQFLRFGEDQENTIEEILSILRPRQRNYCCPGNRAAGFPTPFRVCLTTSEWP